MSELRAAAERVRLDREPGERWGATIAGLALVVGLTLLDALWDKHFPSVVVIGPFLTALRGTERQTAAVGLVAIASVFLSAIWNDTVIGADYFVRGIVVVAGAALAVVAAHRRERARARGGDRAAAQRGALQPRRGRHRPGRHPPAALRQRRGRRGARLLLGGGAAEHAA